MLWILHFLAVHCKCEFTVFECDENYNAWEIRLDRFPMCMLCLYMCDMGCVSIQCKLLVYAPMYGCLYMPMLANISQCFMQATKTKKKELRLQLYECLRAIPSMLTIYVCSNLHCNDTSQIIYQHAAPTTNRTQLHIPSLQWEQHRKTHFPPNQHQMEGTIYATTGKYTMLLRCMCLPEWMRKLCTRRTYKRRTSSTNFRKISGNASNVCVCVWATAACV